jgi:hypothetical protein
MSDITDEMFDAACESAGVSQTGYAPWKDNLRGAIAAALAAAPTVEDLVWCDGHEEVLPPSHCYFHARLGCQDPSCGPCTGTHHTLIIGPEVTT